MDSKDNQILDKELAHQYKGKKGLNGTARPPDANRTTNQKLNGN